MDREKDDHRRIETTAEAIRKQDDFREELAGVKAGRIARHLPEDHTNTEKGRERRAAKAREQRSQLEIPLADPTYLAAHERVMGTLSDYEDRARSALDHVRAQIDQFETELEDMRDRAARLPDGRMVFRDAAGNVRTEDGTLIDGPVAEAIVWPEDAPAYENFEAKREALARAREREAAIESYMVDVLGSARDRLTDEDNPPSLDEIEAIERKIKEEAGVLLEPV